MTSATENDPWAEWDTADGYNLEAMPDQYVVKVIDNPDDHRVAGLVYEYLRVRRLYQGLKAADELADRADQTRFEAASVLYEAVQDFLNNPATGRRRARK
jgi:hypothetical protein